MINSIEWLAFGDSIGLGAAEAAGLLCNARIGRQPHEIVAAIDGTDAAFITGRKVILSTGLSNNPNGLSHAYDAIKDLLLKGAKLVAVLGVGPGNSKTDLTGINTALAAHCAACGPKVFFAGPLPCVRMTGEMPGIHSWSSDAIIDQVNVLLEAL